MFLIKSSILVFSSLGLYYLCTQISQVSRKGIKWESGASPEQSPAVTPRKASPPLSNWEGSDNAPEKSEDQPVKCLQCLRGMSQRLLNDF